MYTSTSQIRDKSVCALNIFHNKCVNTGAVFNSGLTALLAGCFALILKKALEVNHCVSMGLWEIYTAEVVASVVCTLSLFLSHSNTLSLSL